MTMCFQSRAATAGFHRFTPGPAAGIPGVGIRRLASPTRGPGAGGIDATGGGIIRACVQPTTIRPPSTMDVRIRLNLDLITRHAFGGPHDSQVADSSSLTMQTQSGRGGGLYRRWKNLSTAGFRGVTRPSAAVREPRPPDVS